jgi:8-oxo-dGTP pyrophosphatase MutT (NUDIX family)
VRPRPASSLPRLPVCSPFHIPYPSPYLYSLEPRRAAVALLVRVVPAPTAKLPDPAAPPPSLSDFFEEDWVNDPGSRAEILFLHRQADFADNVALTQSRASNGSEAHVAFPGGRTERDDEGGLYTGMSSNFLCLSCFLSAQTAMRQTWEEIGIDLAEKYYTCVGQLDDREITTSLGKRLLMILSPFVFLQVTPSAPPPDPIATTSLHWIPLASLVSPISSPKWSSVTVDAASRIVRRNSTALRVLIRALVGSMQFPAIIIEPGPSPPISSDHSEPLQDSKKKLTSPHDVIERGYSPKVLKLWGLSLGMTLDLMSYMVLPESSRDTMPPKEEGNNSPLSPYMQLPYQDVVEDFRVEYVAPSLASVFPKFSYPDVNFWIW